MSLKDEFALKFESDPTAQFKLADAPTIKSLRLQLRDVSADLGLPEMDDLHREKVGGKHSKEMPHVLEIAADFLDDHPDAAKAIGASPDEVRTIVAQDRALGQIVEGADLVAQGAQDGIGVLDKRLADATAEVLDAVEAFLQDPSHSDVDRARLELRFADAFRLRNARKLSEQKSQARKDASEQALLEDAQAAEIEATLDRLLRRLRDGESDTTL